MKRTPMPPRKKSMNRGRIARGPGKRRTSIMERGDLPLERRPVDEPWEVDPLWPMARSVALRRDRHTCTRCGQPGGDVHHRYAKQMGGRMDDPDRHAPERLVTLCRICHRWVHEHPSAATPLGLRVPTAEDPQRVPVHSWTGTVILSHDGKMSTLQPRYR